MDLSLRYSQPRSFARWSMSSNGEATSKITRCDTVPEYINGTLLARAEKRGYPSPAFQTRKPAIKRPHGALQQNSTLGQPNICSIRLSKLRPWPLVGYGRTITNTPTWLSAALPCEQAITFSVVTFSLWQPLKLELPWIGNVSPSCSFMLDVFPSPQGCLVA